MLKTPLILVCKSCVGNGVGVGIGVGVGVGWVVWCNAWLEPFTLKNSNVRKWPTSLSKEIY